MKRNLSKRITKIFACICTVALVAQSAMAGITAKAASASISLSNQSVKVGDTVEIPVTLNASDVYGGAVDFSFDSSVLDVTSIEAGSLIGDSQVLVKEVKNGVASLAFTLTGNKTGISGNGVVATIKATAKKAGTVNLKNALSVQLLDSNAATINASIGAGTLTIANDGPVVVDYSKVKTFTSNMTTGQMINTTIKFKATSDKDNTNFRFDVKDVAANKWSTVQAYSKTASFAWTPTKAGTYIVRVMVKNVNSDTTKAYDDYKDITFKIVDTVPDVPQITSFFCNKTTGQVGPNTTITFKANAMCSKAFKYQFQEKNVSTGKWTTLQAYSTKNTIKWTPKASGTYIVRVQVKADDSTNKQDNYKDITFKVK